MKIALIYTLILFIATFVFLTEGMRMLIGPGLKLESPEKAIESYWQARNQRNLVRQALHFSYVLLIEAPKIAQEMWPCNIKTYGLEFSEKIVLNDTLIYFKYFVKLERGKFKSGDLMVYNPYFGWRILAPCTDPPTLNDLK